MDSQQGALIRQSSRGVVLAVRLTPRVGIDRIDGEITDSAGQTWLSVRVKAVPDKGRANKALIRLLAKTLGHPAGSIDIIQGVTSRHKRIAIDGTDTQTVRAALKNL